MYSNRDFLGKYIIDRKGKKLGTVEDLMLDIKSREVCGFYVRKNSMRKKFFSIRRKDILYIGNHIIAEKFTEDIFFCFNNLKSKEVFNMSGDILGSVENIIFCEEDFKIKGFLISEGLFRNYSKGKRIILIQDIIIGEENLLYTGDNNYYCYSRIHGVGKHE